MNSSEQRVGGRLVALAAAIFLAGTVVSVLVESDAGWATALLAGPIIISAILFVATLFVTRAGPPAATRGLGLAYAGVATVASVVVVTVLALSSLEARFLIYALPLGSALLLAQVARSLAEKRAGQAGSGRPQ